MTDSDLLARAQTGDSVAFSELVRRHQSLVYRTVLAIVQSRADAEDVTQDAWFRAFRGLAQFHGESAVATWLVAIARNAAIDQRRSARRRADRNHSYPILASESEWTPISCAPSPEDVLLLSEQRSLLADHITKLPGYLRRPLRLWHTGQYTYQDIALATGAKCGTVKSRVWQARKSVLRSLQGQYCSDLASCPLERGVHRPRSARQREPCGCRV